MASREVAEAVAPTDGPVVLGDDRGELVAIDLRDDVTLVEYTSVDDSPWSVLVALVVLNVLDVITTVAVVAAGGIEGNPLMRPLIDGIWGAILLKIVVLATIAWLLARCGGSRRIALMMAFATGWYIAVVSWNLAILGFG